MQDALAFCMMGCHYYEGECGLPQNSTKAVELWRKAGKVGYNNIGFAYDDGDKKMAKHYFELWQLWRGM